jgi:tetratricopeptide (TPR) repeat protein
MVEIPTQSWKLLYEAGRQALQNRKLQEAEQSFSAALQLAEDFAPGDPRLSATLNALARIYSLQRRYLAAAALLNRLLEVTERTLGPSHVQVAGVLTNLAEMYTHLGAAREELELRERALAIRVDDPNADATSLQRLKDRVGELRALLAEQEASVKSDDEIEYEPLPAVRTAEYSAPAAPVREPEPAIAPAPMPARATVAPVRTVSEPSAPMTRPAAWADTSSTHAVSTDSWDKVSYSGSSPIVVPSPSIEMIAIAEQPLMPVARTVGYGFADTRREELPAVIARRIGGRSSLISISVGVLLVAALVAARDFVNGSDDEAVSRGQVSLATAPAQQAVVVTPVARPTTAPATEADPRTVERMIADQRAERETRRANEARESSAERAPRVPSAAELARTLRGVDVAMKAVDQSTRAATDSASAIRLQAPVFKKVKVSDASSGPVIP